MVSAKSSSVETNGGSSLDSCSITYAYICQMYWLWIGVGLVTDWHIGNRLMDWKTLAMDRHWLGFLGNAMQIDEIILRRDL